MKKGTMASIAMQEFSADDEHEESVEEFVTSSAWSSLSLILETQEQSPDMTKLKNREKSVSKLSSGSVNFSQQPRWKLRKRKVVLYDQEMIDGDTSVEGLVDEDLWLSRKRKGSGNQSIKSRKLTRKLRPRCKSVLELLRLL